MKILSAQIGQLHELNRTTRSQDLTDRADGDPTIPPLNMLVMVRNIQQLPDGSEMKQGPRHLLLLLATYHPRIYPSQARLATQMGVARSTVNTWLDVLVGAGLVRRKSGKGRRNSHYRLMPNIINQCGGVTGASQDEDDLDQSNARWV